MKVITIAKIGAGVAIACIFGCGFYLEECYFPAQRDRELMRFVWTAEKEFVARTGRCGDWEEVLRTADDDLRRYFELWPGLLEYRYTVRSKGTICEVLAEPREWRICRPTFLIDAAGVRTVD